jgi:hypothetical protein
VRSPPAAAGERAEAAAADPWLAVTWLCAACWGRLKQCSCCSCYHGGVPATAAAVCRCTHCCACQTRRKTTGKRSVAEPLWKEAQLFAVLQHKRGFTEAVHQHLPPCAAHLRRFTCLSCVAQDPFVRFYAGECPTPAIHQLTLSTHT